jgi:argininosuccinate synthase
VKRFPGKPVAVDGKRPRPVASAGRLNQAGARYVIGRFDLAENRLGRMKSRGIHETAGGTVLYVATDHGQ